MIRLTARLSTYRVFRGLRSHQFKSAARSRATLLAGCMITAGTLIGMLTSVATGEPAARATSAKSLDEQVQEIKTDVLGIAAELGNLEEKLLYPSNTQIAVFVSLEDGESVDVSAAQITIDGKLVAHHIYSFKEVEALEKGGVQRIYTGNIPSGAHQLDVVFSGKLRAGKDFESQESFTFNKDVDPKLVGIKLASGAVGGTTIKLEDW